MTYPTMVPFYQTRGVNFNVVVNALVSNGIPIPEKLPDSNGYYESEFACSPTTGALHWIFRERDRKKEEENKKAVEQLKQQQEALNENYTKLLKQYQDLTALYNTAVNAQQSDAKIISNLKMQLDTILNILNTLKIN